MKRRALKLTVFLFAGAIINIAVAFWGVRTGMRPFGLPVIVHKSPLDLRAKDLWNRHAINGWPEPPKTYDVAYGLLMHSWQLEVLVDDNAPIQAFSTFRRVGNFQVSQSDYGFPFAILRQETWQGIPVTNSLGAIAGTDGTRFRDTVIPNRLLPIRFAINTIFYAVVLWVLFAAPFALRRRIRRKRGQCASCGYSLRENTSDKCPECGAPSGQPVALTMTSC